uniref:Uncharacterized protein n=1 Tax=Poecilia reticulata TaxID=8081 RepID=A0A3P9P350_POERE
SSNISLRVDMVICKEGYIFLLKELWKLQLTSDPVFRSFLRSFVEDRQIELEPLAVKIQGQLQDIEEQLKPLTESVKENVNPLIASLQQKMESILQMLEEHPLLRPPSIMTW